MNSATPRHIAADPGFLERGFIYIEVWGFRFADYISFFSSPKPKAPGELIGWKSSWHPSISVSVSAFTLSNMNISETIWPIKKNFIWSIIGVGD